MNRPEGITQDAWDAATDAWCKFQPSGEAETIAAFARAIQSAVEAERRSIQTEVQDMGVPSAFSNSWQLGYRQCRIDVVAAIRSRKGA